MVQQCQPSSGDTELDTIASKQVQADPRAFEELAALVERVKVLESGGDLTIMQLCGIGQDLVRGPMQYDNTQQVYGWFADAKSQADRLALMGVLLSQLNQTVNTMQTALGNAIAKVAARHGFTKLPNEMLLRILRFVDCTWMHTRKKMSLVCRRFRDVIVNTPDFWTDINNDMDLDNVDLYLARSKNADLSIKVDVSHKGKRDCVEFVRKVVPYCHRWSYFKFSAFFGHAGWADMGDIEDLLLELDLPILRSAAFEHPGTTDNREMDEAINDEEYHFYTSRNAPSLEEVYFANLFPMTNDTFKLKEIRIDICWLGLGEGLEWTPALLGEYLSAQPFVETLELGLTNMDAFEDEDIDIMNPFLIPSLRTLRFRDLSWPGAPLDTVSQILHFLKTPALETLDLRISDKELTGEDMARLLPADRNYENMKHFSLRVEDIDREETPSFQPLKVILEKMPNLQHFKLESPDFRTGISAPYKQAIHPPLRTIYLKDCKGVANHDVRHLVEYLQEGANWKDFEQLRVVGCSSVNPSVKEMLKLLPEKLLLE